MALLLAHQAEVNARDQRGNTPLARAVHYHRQDVVKALLDARADPNLMGKPRWPGKALDGRRWMGRWEHSPMHEAVTQPDTELLQLLLAHGGNPNLVTETFSVVQVARDENNPSALELLKEKGAP